MHKHTVALDALRTVMNVVENVLGGGCGLKESVKMRSRRYKTNGAESDQSVRVWRGQKRHRTQ